MGYDYVMDTSPGASYLKYFFYAFEETKLMRLCLLKYLSMGLFDALFVCSID